MYLIKDIKQKLEAILPAERIKTRLIDLVSYASDAGFYTLTPQAVVQPVNEDEIISLFEFSREHNIPLVFRTGGTSLSGQSITDGILVDLSQHWDKISIENNGGEVRVQPGITGGMVNSYLRKHKKKIGPDPASINSAMMGGILSNNSSGMCCGVKQNSYHTVRHIRFILPDGKVFCTEIEDDYRRFEQDCNELYKLLSNTRKKLLADTELYNKIRGKYQIKNTVGYAVNALIDHEHPLDILAHLLIGAEGTLAFIAETVMNTVPEYPFKSAALLYFPDIYTACQTIVPLNDAGAKAIELMDRASLHAIEHMPNLPAVIKGLPEQACCLLVEFQEDTYAEIEQKVNSFLQQSETLALLHAPVFTSNPQELEYYWKIRKGLFPSVGAVRASGSTVILEDVAFPVPKLGDAILDLQALFKKYEYNNAIIFGHARDGNIHFLITPEFNSPDEVTRYDSFMQEVVTMVVDKYDGALKAEHGTGRNMAPFVQTEWGDEIYEIMKQIKEAVDPANLLNPGVIINADKNVHIKNIKPLPTVEHEVDKCIECGYCEHKCPSRNITTTPRRRIVIRRELKKMELNGDTVNHKILLDQYQYDGMDTCAVDGLCATACPVDINTGELIKRLRRESHSRLANKVALTVARNFGVVMGAARFALGAGSVVNKIFGSGAMTNITTAFKRVIPAMPLWTEQLAAPPNLKLIRQSRGKQPQDAEVIYYPSCISRMLGSGVRGKKSVMDTFMSVSQKAGINVSIPGNVFGSCCSQIFSSKGYADANKYMSNVFIERMWAASNEGKIRVVIDVSSCAYAIRNMRHHLSEANQHKFDRMSIMDCVDYLHDVVMPKQQNISKKGAVVLHPVCSLQKMNTQGKFTALAQHYAAHVDVPVHAGCCGMAGDRGFLVPELTASATLPEALEVQQKQYDGYYSSTKTCEMAMSHAVGQDYESILYLLDEAME
ncbi:FAD-binding oxidoreductase [Mucilaginibacter roseus]|uniref:D-lactate dehydrogenase (cytochrome) n=1 Tax=Mucilaginibacter roseus TaxID=1528868 RepID=A0ABS8U208_9SPHI|nr:FAD-binding and (Fe-S)-binding domain-containing protein [Mucilaginibacter roseus]MCD8740115.1 FAD-binding oxidoreductase [Mucilaginibacter roseus]